MSHRGRSGILETVMTIDERLGALTQSLELVAHMQQAEEKRAAERDAITDARIGRFLDVVEKQAVNIENLADNVENLAGSIDKLAGVAKDHGQRIERLEG